MATTNSVNQPWGRASTIRQRRRRSGCRRTCGPGYIERRCEPHGRRVAVGTWVPAACWLLALGVLCRAGAAALAAEVPAAEPPAAGSDFAARAERFYREAKSQYQAAPTNAPAGWHFARACFDLAEYATNNSQRAALATEGIRASRELVAQHSDLAPAQYYLGMNLGQLARTKTLGALAVVAEMESAFQQARTQDEKFDYAGPDRNLGLLYLEAPGWPLSIGSRPKARRHLLRAVELGPEYPENQLNLLDAFLRWDDTAGARQVAAALTQLLPRARTRFTGESWAASWIDWDKRWRDMAARLNPGPAGDVGKEGRVKAR